MNKIIHLSTRTTPENIKTSLESIVQQLSNDNFAETKSKPAIRLFSRKIPSFYREDNIIMCHDGTIFVKNTHYIEKKGNTSIRIRKH